MHVVGKRRPRVAPVKKGNTVTLPGWLTLRRLVALCLAAPVILPLVFMSLVYGYDQHRHGSLYAMCDEMPVGSEYAPLKREVFQHGCYTKSVCPHEIYTVSRTLVSYEVISLRHCLKERVQRPDRAIRRMVYELNRPKAPPQVDVPEVDYDIQVADAAQAP